MLFVEFMQVVSLGNTNILILFRQNNLFPTANGPELFLFTIEFLISQCQQICCTI